MPVDWTALGERLVDEIVGAVARARSVVPDATVVRVEIVDVHARDLLVLWPTFRVRMTGSPPLVVEGSRHGDLCAADVTSLGGPGGIRWDTVFSQYHGRLATACADASRIVGAPVSVAAEPGSDPPTPADIDEHVAADGPLDYGPLTDTLTHAPDLDGPLAAGLTAETVRPVDADDVATAIAALDSPWESIRRHAAIVLLSAHL